MRTENADACRIIEEACRKAGRLRTYNIIIDSDHAAYVEFGTGPANTKDPSFDQYGHSVKERIARWVDEKFGSELTAKQKHDMAFSVYKRIMQEGIPPAPFVRPAVDEVMNDPETLALIFNAGDTSDGMYRLAEYVVDRIKENLYKNGTVYHHDIEDHIYIKKSEYVLEPTNDVNE